MYDEMNPNDLFDLMVQRKIMTVYGIIYEKKRKYRKEYIGNIYKKIRR
jgi:hypothetical protein